MKIGIVLSDYKNLSNIGTETKKADIFDGPPIRKSINNPKFTICLLKTLRGMGGENSFGK